MRVACDRFDDEARRVAHAYRKRCFTGRFTVIKLKLERVFGVRVACDRFDDEARRVALSVSEEMVLGEDLRLSKFTY